MNRKEAEQIVVPLYRNKLLDRAQRLTKFFSRKVERAIKAGKVEVVIGRRPIISTLFFWNPRNLMSNEECRHIAEQYFVDLGFDVYYKMWCEHIYQIRISWRPDNLTKDCTLCTEDDKLRQLVLTGKAPVVIDDK